MLVLGTRTVNLRATWLRARMEVMWLNSFISGWVSVLWKCLWREEDSKKKVKTSFVISLKVKSLRVRNIILWSGLLGSVAQLTNVLRKDVVETLTSNVSIAFPQAHIWKTSPRDLIFLEFTINMHASLFVIWLYSLVYILRIGSGEKS